jgi:CBS domain-containing protein
VVGGRLILERSPGGSIWACVAGGEIRKGSEPGPCAKRAPDRPVLQALQEAGDGDENNEATYDRRTMVTAKNTPKQLGQMLLEQGLLTQPQLDIALRQHRNTPKSLGRTLIDLGYIRERDLVRALAKQVGLDFVDLRVHRIDPVAAALLPDQLARRYRALPIGERDGKLLVAMSDPANLYALDDIRAVTSREVQPVVATATDVEDAIDKFAKSSFGDLHAVSQGAEGSAPNGVRPSLDEPKAVLHARASYAGSESPTRTSLPGEASIKRLVNATWVLAGATISLIFVTIVLIFITART